MPRRLFTSESVTEGHPDKIADQISDAILDEMLRQDPRSRVAVETLITTGQVHIAGEVTTAGYVDIADVVRKTVLRIGYDSSRKGCDLLVVNDVSGGGVFGRPDNAAVVLAADGTATEVPHGTKDAVAAAVWQVVVPRLGEPSAAPGGTRR